MKTNCDGNKPYCVYTHNTEYEKEIAYLKNDKKAAAADVPTTTHKICLPYHTHCLTLRDYISLCASFPVVVCNRFSTASKKREKVSLWSKTNKPSAAKLLSEGQPCRYFRYFV